MNKFFTKIAGLTLGLAMAIGVGVAIGSKEAKKVSASIVDGQEVTISVAKDSTSVSNECLTLSINDSTGAGYNPWRLYAEKKLTLSSSDATVTFKKVVIITTKGNFTLGTFSAGSATNSETTWTWTNSTGVSNLTYTHKSGAAQITISSVTVTCNVSGGGGGGGGDTKTDTYSLDGKNIIISSNNSRYLPKTIGTSGRPSSTGTKSDSAIFLFTLVDDDTFTLQLTNGDNSGKFLKTGTSTGSSSSINVGATAENWEVVTSGGYKYLKDEDGHYLSANSTTDWRMYAAASGGGPTTNGNPKMSFEEASTDPAITSVALSGSPAASATIGGGNSWKMSATVTAVNDPSEILSRNVNWTVSPSGAVTFSKSTSASGEEITVTAVNTANNNVKVTASSAATGFTSVHADSNTFNIIKSYVVSSVTLSVTTAGGPTYDAAGASSFVVGFTTAVNYSGDAGTSKVNIAVSPNAGVSGYGDNVTAGAFNLTFTKSGTYTVTSTSVENNQKIDSEIITINNIVVPGYEKITTASNIRAGSQLIIYSTYVSSNNTYHRVMNTTQAANNRGYVDYTVSNDFIPLADVSTNSMEVITLEDSGDGYWYLKTIAEKYLYYPEATKNYLRSRDNNETDADLAKFTISFNNGIAQVVPKADTSRKIQFNHSNTCFSCYTGTQNDIELYLKIDASPYFTINMTTAYIGVKGTQEISVTAHNGASATISWSTSSSSNVSIPKDSTGTSVVATGVAEGDSIIKATFTPLDGNTYPDISCAVTVVAIDEYVNIGVTNFTKVTSEPTGGWEGTYLIVDETTSVCFDGSISPLSADGTKAVSISNSTIAATTSTISSSFNIKESENSGYYNIRSNSGFYIGGTDKSIYINIGETYDVTISSSGEITGTSSSTLQYVSTGGYFRFYTNSTGNTLSLYKADGERRAISSTLSAFYDAVKENEYLVCHASGTGSKVDFDGIIDCTGDLTTQDYDTLKRMSAKSSEDNGNYLEDLISDYDYLVQFKGETDIFGRFDEGGAMYGHAINRNNLKLISKNAGTTIAIVVISSISLAAIGGYFLFRKKKED